MYDYIEGPSKLTMIPDPDLASLSLSSSQWRVVGGLTLDSAPLAMHALAAFLVSTPNALASPPIPFFSCSNFLLQFLSSTV